MPSTATTNVTISTILDLIGPAPSSLGNGDDQSAFDSVLNRSPPSPASPPQPSESSQRSSDQRLAPTTSHNDDSRPAQSSSSASQDDSNSDNSQSKPNDKTLQAEATGPHSDRDQPEQPAEKSDDAQELIAQSLAGLPAASAKSPLPESAVAGEESAASTDEFAATEAKSRVAQTTNRTAQQAAAQAQANDPKAVAPASEVAAATTGEQPTKPSAEKLTTPRDSTPTESAKSTTSLKQATTDQTETTDKPAQSTEATIEPSLDKDKSSQSSHQESSSDNNPQSNGFDPAAVANSTPDTTTPANPAATTPIVAPVTAAISDNKPGPTDTANQNQTSTIAASGPRSRLPAQALAPASATSNRRPAVEVDSARLLSRVVRAFSAAQERDGEVHLRLSPPELGSLRLDIRVDNGALTAHLQTETDAARTAIIDNLPALRERLAEQGVRIERFDVDLMQRQPGGMPDQSGGRQPETSEPTPRFVQPARTNSVVVPSPSLVSPVNGTASGLNVIV